MSTSQTARQHSDARIDVRVVLSALWIAMLIVFAYVDIFGSLRADVIDAAREGKVAAAGVAVDQVFLALTTAYILIPTLMVVLTLVLRPRVNRIVNIVVGLLYAVSIVASCIGEGWAYYLLGSAVEVVLLAAIVRTAWTWPAVSTTLGQGAARMITAPCLALRLATLEDAEPIADLLAWTCTPSLPR